MVPMSSYCAFPVEKKSFRRRLARLLHWFVVMLSIAGPAWAKEHPVPLEKNVDSAKCLACHNSDDSREFGGAGANGPHGSKWTHLLERRYEFSQAPAPGQLITNLFPNPDVTVNGPYAMCGKSHDLPNNILANTSWNQHALHVSQYGFSCSVCHTAHGMGATSPTFTGERLVNFDANVVAPNAGTPIGYNRSTNTCSLTCHNAAQSANGTVAGPTGHIR